MSRWISLIVLLAVIVVTGILLYKVMAAFLLPLFLATVLTVIFRPVHTWMVEKCKGRALLAATLTTAVILLAVLAPVGGILAFGVHEGMDAVGSDVVDQAEMKIERFRTTLGLQVPFAVFTDDEQEVYLLREIDAQIRQLPNTFPDPDSIAPVERQRIAFLVEAIGALQQRLQEIRKQVANDLEATDDEPIEQRRVKQLLASSGENAFEEIEEIHETLLRMAAYLDIELAGQAVELPESDTETDTIAALSELVKRYSRLPAKYESFRLNLLGGAIWAGLTDLANPGTEQIASLRNSVESYLRGWLPSVAGQATAFAGALLLGLAIMTLSVFYFLKDGPAMIGTLMRLSPLDDRYEQELLVEFDRVSRAVVLATLLSAVGQGLLASIGYYFAGFEAIFLLTMLTMVFALVPFVGAAAVWLPACLWLGFVEQRIVAAIVLLIYGLTVISMADNLIKPYILHGQSKLHPLLALLSVLGGVQALGPIGLLVGPMAVSFLQALLNILQKELQSLDNTRSRSQK